MNKFVPLWVPSEYNILFWIGAVLVVIVALFIPGLWIATVIGILLMLQGLWPRIKNRASWFWSLFKPFYEG